MFDNNGKFLAHSTHEVFASREDGETHYLTRSQNGHTELFIDTAHAMLYEYYPGADIAICAPIDDVDKQIEDLSTQELIETPTLRDCNEDGYAYALFDRSVVIRTMVVDFNTASEEMISKPTLTQCFKGGQAFYEYSSLENPTSLMANQTQQSDNGSECENPEDCGTLSL